MIANPESITPVFLHFPSSCCNSGLNFFFLWSSYKSFAAFLEYFNKITGSKAKAISISPEVLLRLYFINLSGLSSTHFFQACNVHAETLAIPSFCFLPSFNVFASSFGIIHVSSLPLTMASPISAGVTSTPFFRSIQGLSSSPLRFGRGLPSF